MATEQHHGTEFRNFAFDRITKIIPMESSSLDKVNYGLQVDKYCLFVVLSL
jgi:hypothetical protein